MKKIKKLSLKEEINREAAAIEKKIMENRDLDDIKVSDEMETSLFNKIQKYEHEKKAKTVHRKKKKRYILVALAAVLVLAFGSTMTGVGSRPYWRVIWDRMVGEESVTYIDTENMDLQETEDFEEIQAFRDIGAELGISAVRLAYKPQGMVLNNYEIDAEQRRAILFYNYNEEIIRYALYTNDSDSSFAQRDTDKLVERYEVKTLSESTVKVEKYEVEDISKNRFIAEFEYMDVQYQLMGIMEQDEFDKILQDLIFFR